MRIPLLYKITAIRLAEYAEEIDEEGYLIVPRSKMRYVFNFICRIPYFFHDDVIEELKNLGIIKATDKFKIVLAQIDDLLKILDDTLKRYYSKTRPNKKHGNHIILKKFTEAVGDVE